MHLFACLSALTLAVSPTVSAHAQARSDSAASAQIAALVAAYDSAWERRDSPKVDLLLAQQYQYFSSRGDVSSRSESLAFLVDPTYVLRQAARSELSVSVAGPVAVVSSRWRGEGSYRGEGFKDDQRCGQTWVRTGGTWRLLSEHCVQIAPPPPS